MTESLVDESGSIVAARLTWARGFVERAWGLLGRAPLSVGEALVLVGAKQVHTFGLGYPIDVVFCDRDWRVLKVVRDLRPKRISPLVLRARYAVEMPAGAVPDNLVPTALLKVGAEPVRD